MVQMMADLLFNEYPVEKFISGNFNEDLSVFLQDRGKTECSYSNIQVCKIQISTNFSKSSSSL